MRAEEFKQNLVFDRSLGELVMKVCAHTCHLCPEVHLRAGVFMLHHYYGAGHYDATALVEDERSCIFTINLTAFCFYVEQVQLVISLLRAISVQCF